ncbi:hypothetical protein EWM64_g3309 [Hericium alpestre]|uniref:F-box domain-containing protein n=1 Tax=Hericium alpestre TaxID=135208 RepID=A0A4Z0A305_9AGAM|nr:hypothetical protein EWM64_g3309 [Hericium alpestre]
MSDINDIPLELLLCVFCWCTVASPDAPLQIAAVCHTWRALALRTPELWTRLDLRFARSPNAEFPDASETRAIEKSDVWMQRAMQSAVDVSITIAHQAMRLPMANFMFVPLLALPTPLVFSKTTLHDSPLAQRKGIEKLAGTVRVMKPNGWWNGQNWIVELLNRAVEEDIITPQQRDAALVAAAQP